MADSIEVTVTLGYDGIRDGGLHAYLTAPLGAPAQDGSESGQHLTLVCGNETHPDGFDGSGQAGTIRIYAGCIRRGRAHDVIDYLRAAPWGHKEAVVVVHDSYGPAVVERLGHTPEPEMMWHFTPSIETRTVVPLDLTADLTVHESLLVDVGVIRYGDGDIVRDYRVVERSKPDAEGYVTLTLECEDGRET